MKNTKYTVLSFLGMLALSAMLVSCYSLWDDLSAVPKVTITYVSEKGTPPAPKQVNVGHKLTAADLPNMETDTEYGAWDKTVGTEITADTTITASWETIVYLKNFKGIIQLAFPKSNFEKTVFTEDTYTGDTTNTIGCADDINNPGYFTGVISSDNKVFTIYGNGHRIYAPVDSSQLFSGFNKLNSIEFNNFYTSKVTNMMAMLSCEELTSLDLSSFNTSKVTDMTGMFETCEDITSLDLSSFDTSSVTNMAKMFKECKELTTLNVSSFDTSKVTNMKDMFNGCAKLTELDISSFDTSSVLWTSMGGCGLFIFNGCSSLVTIYASDKFVSTAPNLTIFDGCTSLVGGTGTKYSDGDTSDPDHYKTALYAHIDGGSSNPGYFTLKQ